ncbi:hypothetical protein [Corynebacterium hiratae]|uniref:hypothetical protein n=1 Tax=Corynebacterium hiratae TaxID=3139423 RepID=UPI00163DAD90|nr:hypothetical protein [Corynebacterium aurimucosum]
MGPARGPSQRLERLASTGTCRRRVAVIAIVVVGFLSGIATRLVEDVRGLT